MEEPIFDPSRLKKKIKKGKSVDSAEKNLDSVQGVTENNTDKVYSYDFMLERLYEYQSGNHKNKEKIPFPHVNVSKDMIPTSTIVNYAEICKTMNREQLHVMLYIKLELQPKKMSINAKNQLWLRGRYDTKQVKTVLSNYTNEYVRCKTCGDLDTFFTTNQGILQVECKKCQGKRAVPKLKEA